MLPSQACTDPDLSTPVSADAITPSVAPDVSVSQLLSEAREHAKARTRLANRLSANKHHTPDYRKAVAHAQFALEARNQAHQLDPEHADPAWALDAVPHAELCAFLQKYIETP